MRALFSDKDDKVSDRGFSPLHKAVLQLELSDLGEKIKTHKSEIDDKDVDGYTALVWASRRGNGKAIQFLVHAGADVLSPTHSGESALHYAARYSNIQAVKALLEAGADTRQVNREGLSPLHFAAESTRDVGVIDCLISAGAELNAMTNRGMSPLHVCALSNRVAVAKSLLDKGAEINIISKNGESALLLSVYRNADDVTQLLLSRGANHGSRSGTGYSILHLAALSGSLRTLKILRDARLQYVDPDALSRQGHTAIKLAFARVSKPDGFIQKLQGLLVDIRTRNADLQNTRTTAFNVAPGHSILPRTKIFQLLPTITKTQIMHQTLSTRRYVVSCFHLRSLWYLSVTLLALSLFWTVYSSIGHILNQVTQGLGFWWYMFSPGDAEEL